MNVVAAFKTAVEQLTTALLAATANPRPQYSIEGQSVSFNDYIRMLLDAIKTLNEAILMYEPFELKSVMG